MNSKFRRRRGRAEYFHGRDEIMDTFDAVLENYRSINEGSTFLIKGPPGAGKTALLTKLSQKALVADDPWAVAKIGVKDLYDPVSLAQALGKAYFIDAEIAIEVGIKVVAGKVVGHVAGLATPTEILRHLTPETGLILVLDEAQRLRNIPNESEIHVVAEDTLDLIHNGDVGHPVMLLTAGLGTTESAYDSLGVSRFEDNCRIRLGSLDHQSTCAVIRDLIVAEGGVVKPPPSWVKDIAEHTHGWPHHIISYAGAAADHLVDINRMPTEEDLQIVLAQGRVNQIDYYQTRAKGISKKDRQILAQLFIDLPPDGTVDKEDIMFAFKEKYSVEDTCKFFENTLHRGILDERQDGDYGIPIPSLHAWLVDEYARNKSQDIPQTSKQLSPMPDQILLPSNKDDPSGVKKDKGDDEDKRKGKGGFSMER